MTVFVLITLIPHFYNTIANKMLQIYIFSTILNIFDVC